MVYLQLTVRARRIARQLHMCGATCPQPAAHASGAAFDHVPCVRRIASRALAMGSGAAGGVEAAVSWLFLYSAFTLFS